MNARYGRPASILALLLVTALALAACGSDDDGDNDSERTVTETTTVTDTSTDTTTTATTSTGSTDVDDDDRDDDDTQPAVTCSASGLDDTLDISDQAGLPAAVQDVREDIFDAAVDCDYRELEAIGERNAGAFAHGGGAGSAADYWRTNDAKDRIMERIARVLSTPYVDKRDDGPRAFAWPGAHVTNPPAAAWTALTDSGAYTAAEVASFRSAGSYTGLRIGILPDGKVSYINSGG